MKINKNKVTEICLSIEKIEDSVSHILNKKLSKSYNDNEILQILSEINEKYLFSNAAIINKTLELLQLLNDDSNVNDVNLEKIGTLYKKLIKSAEFDVSIYESAYYYYYAVLDRPEEIKDSVLKGINKIKNKLNEIEGNVLKIDK